MKNKLFAAACAAMLATASFAAGAADALRVGTHPTFAPFEFMETASRQYVGFDMDLIREIGKRAGLEVEIVNMGFDGLIPALMTGTIDIAVSGITITDERLESVDFTNAYLDSNQAIVVKKDSKYAGASKLSDFTGATVLGQKDTFYDDLIDEIPQVNHLTPVATVPLVVDGIENGTCDAITFSSMSLPKLLNSYPDLMKVELEDGQGFSDPSNPDNAAIAKGQDAMLAKLNEIIGGAAAVQSSE